MEIFILRGKKKKMIKWKLCRVFLFSNQICRYTRCITNAIKKNLFICCSRVEINEFSSLGFSQELKIIHKVFGTMFFQKIQRSTNDLRYYCGTFRIRVNSLYFFTPYISSYSVFLIFVTKIIYYCSKDNILLHGEIQILVLSHRKQIAKY